MATTEEIQKLIMQVQGQRELERLIGKQAEAEKLMRKLTDRFEEGRISQTEYAKRTEIVATHLLRLRERTEETEKSLGKARGGMRNFSQEMRTLGYITQDFAQGGFGGILNNIDQLLYKFPALAGGVTIAATAIWAFGPAIKQMVDGLIEGSNKLPETTDKLERLTEQTKKNADRLNELKGKQSLTNAELAEYNKLLAGQSDLEKQLNDERERRNALEAQLRREQEASEPERPESARLAGEAMTALGGAKRVEADLARRMEEVELPAVAAEQAERLADLRARQKTAASSEEFTFLLGEIDKAENMLSEARADIAERAKGVVSGALTGEETQIRNLMGAFPRGGFERAIPQAIVAAQIKAKADADAKEAERQEAAGQLQRAAQAARLEEAKRTKAEADQKRADAEAERSRRETERAAAEAPKRAREAQLQEIAGRINYDTGGQLPEAVLMDAAKSTQDLMSRGVEPMMAAQMALAEVARANEQLQQQMAALQAGFNSIADQQRAMRMQNSRMMGGQIAGGGFSGLPMYQGGM